MIRMTIPRPTSATQKCPLRLVAGSSDELFDASQYAAVFKAAGRVVPVTLVEGSGHMGLTLDSAAVQAVARACAEQGGADLKSIATPTPHEHLSRL